MNSPYAEYAPDRRLAEYVACYWSTDVPLGSRQRYAVLPDGCIDLLFDTACAQLNVVGTMSTALWVDECGPVQFVGVRFKPGGAVPFLRERANLFTDSQAHSEVVLGRVGHELSEQLATATNTAARVAMLEAYLLARLAATAPVDPRIAFATHRLQRDPSCRVADLSRQLTISRQHLRRLFLEHTGLSAKAFARVARLGALMPALAGNSLSAAALQAGYADQAHMSNEFRQLVGVAPTAYRKQLASD